MAWLLELRRKFQHLGKKAANRCILNSFSIRYDESYEKALEMQPLKETTHLNNQIDIESGKNATKGQIHFIMENCCTNQFC